jgi:uncharacterized protein (TIGR02246 family)
MTTPTHRRHGLPPTLALALAAALALPGLSASAQTAPPSPPAAVAGVSVQSGPSEAVQAWRRAVEAGDGAAIARMNGPDTVAYAVDGAVVRGGEAIAAGYAGMFAKNVATVEIRDAAWVRQGPLLNSWGQFTLTLTPRDGGKPMHVDGRFSDLAVWTDGHWQYLMDHASGAAR